MKYIASKDGYFGGKRIKEGEDVEAPEGIESKWLIPEKDYKPRVVKPFAKEPSTYSEIARSGPAPAPKTSPGRPVEPKKERASDKPVI